jgi:hypothetical protein
VRTPTTNALTVQKVVTPGFTKLTPSPAAPTQPAIARAPIPTLVGPLPASLKMSSSPKVKMIVYLEWIVIFLLQHPDNVIMYLYIYQGCTYFQGGMR